MHLKPFVRGLAQTWLQNNSPWIIAALHIDFWHYRQALAERKSPKPPKLYTAYLDRFNAFIGVNANIESEPVLPHGLCGIFISNSAKIGRGVIIFHHVTIGSNTIKGSKGYGAPVIEDGVLIGAGAKIIGNVTIGRNSRIGAGCVITRSIPADSVVVMPQPRVIEKESLSNTFTSNDGSLF